MTRLALPASALSVFLGTSAAVAPASSAPGAATAQARPGTPQYYWICEGTVSNQRGFTMLAVSKVFPADPGLSLANDLGTGSPSWNKTTVAWHRYLLHKYLPEEEKKRDQLGYFTRGRAQGGPPGTCRAGTLSAVQGTHDRDVKGGSVEEDWVYILNRKGE